MVSLGTRRRAYGSGCQQRTRMRQMCAPPASPGKIGRLQEIITNLRDRIGEGQEQVWLGEAGGLRISVDAARIKLAQMERRIDRGGDLVQLALPARNHRD
jgi:hypothetical protein